MYNIKNKGFSLVELIIVIAIISVLIAVLTPLYIKYVEQSKVTTDTEIASSVHDALAVAIADENIEERPVDGFSPVSKIKLEQIGVTTDKTYTEFVNSLKIFLNTDDLSTVKTGLRSKQFKGQDIMVEIDENTQRVTVTIPAVSGDTNDDLIVK